MLDYLNVVQDQESQGVSYTVDSIAYSNNVVNLLRTYGSHHLRV